MSEIESGSSTPAVAEPARARLARKQVFVFLSLVVLGSAVFEGLLLRSGRPLGESPGLVLAGMWTPGVASILSRLIFGEGFRDVSFRLGGATGWRALGLAWSLPACIGALAYGLAWSTGLARLEVPLLAKLGLESFTAPVRFVLLVCLGLTLVSLVSLLSAAGEEIGWRGYLLTRLVEAKVPRPVLVTGLVWAAWHLPLILSGQYAAGPSRALSAVTFTLTVVGTAFVMARMRLVTGSVWPAVVLHASWNAVIQGVFDASTKGPSIWVGEAGLLVAATSLGVAWLLCRRPYFARRAPGEEPFATIPGLRG